MNVAGVPVLTIPPTPPDEWTEAIRAVGTRVETPGGNVVTGTFADRYPTATHEWRRICRTRAELAEVEGLFHGWYGAFTALWLPVVRRDARLIQVEGAIEWVVSAPGFGTGLFPDPMQRRVFIYGTGTYRQVQTIAAVVANGDGTDTWWLNLFQSYAEGVGSITTSSMIAQLAPVRLAEEGWSVEFLTPTVSIVTARFVELQEELS